jgi:branched-chain amino acid aminotransferase
VIASPAGAYFADGVAPIKIWLTTEYSRAGRGGTGAAKCGGNYASSLLPQMEAYENGCAQVLFLDAETGTNVDELGGMNVFFVFGETSTLVTPRLTGSILEGVTRDSILQLARDRGMDVEERDVSIDEWRDGVASGAITEVFACGTAAVITPIAQLKNANVSIGDPDAPAGDITMALRQELTDIQYGRLPDRHGWLTRLDA